MNAPQPTSQPARHRAFTLLEVLLATAVAAVVLVAVQGVLAGAIRLRQQATRTTDHAYPLERALAILRQDLAHLLPPQGGFEGSLDTANTLTTSLTGQVGPEFLTAASPLFDQSPWSEAQRVAYVLSSTNLSDQAHPEARQLQRFVYRNLLPSTFDEPTSSWLLDDVIHLEFLYHDGAQWKSDWNATAEATPLPRAIKAQIQRAPTRITDPLPPLIELVVPLFIDGVTNSTATASSSPQTGP